MPLPTIPWGRPVILVALLLYGCSPVSREGEQEFAVSQPPPNIEFLGFSECPNTPTLRDRLRTALAAVDSCWTFKDIDQEGLPNDDLRRGFPTPTILVDGRDLYGLPTPSQPSMGCRVYRGGLPSTQSIVERLNESVTQD